MVSGLDAVVKTVCFFTGARDTVVGKSMEGIGGLAGLGLVPISNDIILGCLRRAVTAKNLYFLDGKLPYVIELCLTVLFTLLLH